MKTKSHPKRPTTIPDRTPVALDIPSPDGMSETLPPTQQPSPQTTPTLEMIRERAYHKWLEAGSPPGDGREFWEKAETELNGMSGEWLTNGGNRSMRS